MSPVAAVAGGEAAVAAALGGGLAVVGLVAVKSFVIDRVLAPSFQFTAFVGWDAVVAIAPILLVTGIALSSVAAFFTLRKYLRV